MNKQLRPLVLIILIVAALLYLAFVGYAGIVSISTEGSPNIPNFMTQVVTVIGAALGTHFGAIFGISQVQGEQPWVLKAFRRLSGAETEGGMLQASREPLDMVQVVAAYFYFGVLLLGVILWFFDGPFSEDSAEILKNISYSFIGVIGGVLAVRLNTQQ